ncbi:hypothetical protein DH2020_004607 [Rehmannia glutinosa]|uniref:Retrotransposon gag domain-containing protein n=1 Tax=Rehmannia glutinosa TaxID=99300 RepID=A0ABR0XPV0_REHGL
MHFEGKTSPGTNFNTKQVELTWAPFVEIISSRFEELKEAKIIGEFNKLKHLGTYAEYVEKFEELQACMLMLNKGNYTEEYFVASFISGLNDEVCNAFTTVSPNWVQQVIQSYAHDPFFTMILAANTVDPTSYPDFLRWELEDPSFGRIGYSFDSQRERRGTTTFDSVDEFKLEIFLLGKISNLFERNFLTLILRDMICSKRGNNDSSSSIAGFHVAPTSVDQCNTMRINPPQSRLGTKRIPRGRGWSGKAFSEMIGTGCGISDEEEGEIEALANLPDDGWIWS